MQTAAGQDSGEGGSHVFLLGITLRHAGWGNWQPSYTTRKEEEVQE